MGIARRVASCLAMLNDCVRVHEQSGQADSILLLQFRDYFGRVVGRCRERVSMKDGLECDARILRMRYSSLDWVRSLAAFPASLSGSPIWSLLGERSPVPWHHSSVHAWGCPGMRQCSQQWVGGPCTG